MDFNQDQISEKLHSLPRELREAIVDADLENLTENLRAKYGLHIDQLGRLIFEVNLILVGLVPNREFQSRIVKNVGVAEDVANLITYDLNRELFAKIRASLRNDEGQGEEISEPATPTEVEPRSAERGSTSVTSVEDQAPKEMFERKMAGLAGAAKQTIEVATETGDNKETSTVAPVKRDPYREPI